MHALKHEGPQPVLQALAELARVHPDNEKIAGNLGYLQRRERQMQYPEYQRDGWPIGSGVVESANKLVVEARLKGPGMHWERTHVNWMLALRNGKYNQRWEETWVAASRHRRQEGGRRRTVAQTGASAAALPAVAAGKPPEPSSPGLQREAKGSGASEARDEDQRPTTAKPPGPRRPASDHPWRQYGRKLGSARRVSRQHYAEV